MAGSAHDRASTERQVLAPLLRRLRLPETLVSPLVAHARAVELAAERLGVVGPGDRANVVRRHTADSLLFALAAEPSPGQTWVDVGSGAGFPGLVLACCYPRTRFVLSEILKKRAGFLEVQVATLGLANVEVLSEAFVDGANDVAVARALGPPHETLARLIALVRPGGRAIVAVGSGPSAASGVQDVRFEDLEVVDSPRRLFIMTRGDGSDAD